MIPLLWSLPQKNVLEYMRKMMNVTVKRRDITILSTANNKGERI